MLNLDVWKKGDLQHFVQMLNQCESAGMTDIRAIRTQLHNKLYQPRKVRAEKRKKRTAEHVCSECNIVLRSTKDCKAWPIIKGMEILVCPKCSYSKVI